MRSSLGFLCLSLSIIACAPAQPASGEVLPLEAFALDASAADGCAIDALYASYVDDGSGDRGRVAVRWGGSTSRASVTVEVFGAPPVTASTTGRELLTRARIQDALDVDQRGVEVRVRVELECGAHAEQTFVFEDPISRCAAPTLATIDRNEAVFYECAEQWVNGGAGCGERGYLVGYGTRYARAFHRETRPRMSARGKPWLDRVLVCLQEELRDAIHLDSSCDEIRRTAFDQHPRCYAENGFCTLPVTDVLKVVGTIDGRDLISSDGLRQVVQIVPECGRAYAIALGLLH